MNSAGLVGSTPTGVNVTQIALMYMTLLLADYCDHTELMAVEQT